jgi:hypothetical protein
MTLTLFEKYKKRFQQNGEYTSDKYKSIPSFTETEVPPLATFEVKRKSVDMDLDPTQKVRLQNRFPTGEDLDAAPITKSPNVMSAFQKKVAFFETPTPTDPKKYYTNKEKGMIEQASKETADQSAKNVAKKATINRNYKNLSAPSNIVPKPTKENEEKYNYNRFRRA